MIMWSVEAFPNVAEYEDLGQAMSEAEMLPYARLIKWWVEPNLPGLKPDKVWKSLRMYMWDSKAWWAIEIHGPGTSRWMERPDHEA